MTVAFAVFVIVHGFAHIVGFLTLSRLMKDETMQGDPFLLGEHEPGSPVMWVFAVVWLLLAAGFMLAGVGLLADTGWALPLLFAATAVSTVLSIVWVRQAPFGLIANLIIIAAVAIPWISDRVLP